MVFGLCGGHFYLGLSPIFAPNKPPTWHTKTVPNWYARAGYDILSHPLPLHKGVITNDLYLILVLWINKKLLTDSTMGSI